VPITSNAEIRAERGAREKPESAYEKRLAEGCRKVMQSINAFI